MVEAKMLSHQNHRSLECTIHVVFRVVLRMWCSTCEDAEASQAIAAQDLERLMAKRTAPKE